ncbi:hypothetical protein GcM3_036038 [Golovinomyces cichoracearum]|uniref:Uncharacterized protein n=1 Tax=Golovinomyces cichoracearum TaxID=62708 RepID=A0A420J3E2_9PEZI|nr:hypothetical protein GcM3_036038 [Golovinomyces cichoracearum]
MDASVFFESFHITSQRWSDFKWTVGVEESAASPSLVFLSKTPSDSAHETPHDAYSVLQSLTDTSQLETCVCYRSTSTPSHACNGEERRKTHNAASERIWRESCRLHPILHDLRRPCVLAPEERQL